MNTNSETLGTAFSKKDNYNTLYTIWDSRCPPPTCGASVAPLPGIRDGTDNGWYYPRGIKPVFGLSQASCRAKCLGLKMCGSYSYDSTNCYLSSDWGTVSVWSDPANTTGPFETAYDYWCPYEPAPPNCGVTGNADMSRLYNIRTDSKVFTQQGCAQLCSQYPNCLSYYIGAGGCGIQITLTESLIIDQGPTAAHTFWDASCPVVRDTPLVCGGFGEIAQSSWPYYISKVPATSVADCQSQCSTTDSCHTYSWQAEQSYCWMWSTSIFTLDPPPSPTGFLQFSINNAILSHLILQLVGWLAITPIVLRILSSLTMSITVLHPRVHCQWSRRLRQRLLELRNEHLQCLSALGGDDLSFG